MRARSIVAILAAGLAVCAGIAAGYVFLVPLVFPAPGIEPRLADIDAAISGGYLSTAREELLAVRPFPRREADALRLLKRAFLVCRQSGDMRLLAALGDRAMEAQGRSSSVRLVAAYAFLRAGRLQDAEAAARSGLPGAAGELLRGEIALRKGAPWQGSDGLTRALVGLESSQKASDFVAASRQVDDSRLALDAALLSLRDGDLSRARSLAASSLQEAKYDEVSALIDYDAGDVEGAVARFTRMQSHRHARADVALLLADCYHLLGRSSELEASLLEAITIDPRVSWTPYADLALAGRRKGDFLFAGSVLDRGRTLFPHARELVLTAARLEAAQGNSAAAAALLDGLVADNPNDARAALLRLSLRAPGMSPEAYRGELWRLFDRLPSDREVFLTLTAGLIAAHDWPGAATALASYQAAAGTGEADSLALSAAVQAMQGHDQQATALMKDALQSSGDEKYRYDLAILLLHSGDARAALEQLAPAEGDNAFLARVETLRGRCLLAVGDAAGARAAFLRARTLDPHLLRPGLELRKLEAPGLQ